MNKNEKYFLNSSHHALSSFQSSGRIRQIKKIATKQFLEGEFGFDEFSRIVGFDIAEQIKVGKETLEESIERAKRKN